MMSANSKSRTEATTANTILVSHGHSNSTANLNTIMAETIA